MTKTFTLAALIAETYTDNETKFFVLCDDGNGSAHGLDGRTLQYDDVAAADYGDVVLRPTLPHMTDDRTECVYASDWIDGENGYRFQIRF